MYPTLLATHSLVRWLVLVALLVAIGCGYNGWFSKRKFSRFDNAVRHWTATIAHIQLILGLWLYTISPFASQFLRDFGDAVHQRDLRFFGMEHSLMMVVAVVLITIGSAKAKRKTVDTNKFKTMAIWYTIGLLIILASIPWAFSPFTSRPLFRPLFQFDIGKTRFIPAFTAWNTIRPNCLRYPLGIRSIPPFLCKFDRIER